MSDCPPAGQRLVLMLPTYSCLSAKMECVRRRLCLLLPSQGDSEVSKGVELVF
jgi:hypothetical protein